MRKPSWISESTKAIGDGTRERTTFKLGRLPIAWHTQETLQRPRLRHPDRSTGGDWWQAYLRDWITPTSLDTVDTIDTKEETKGRSTLSRLLRRKHPDPEPPEPPTLKSSLASLGGGAYTTLSNGIAYWSRGYGGDLLRNVAARASEVISDSVSRANSALVGEGTATAVVESSVSDAGQAMGHEQRERTSPTIEDLRRLAPADLGRSLSALPIEEEQPLPWIHSSSDTQTIPSRLVPTNSIPASVTSTPRVEAQELIDHVYSAPQVEARELTDHLYPASIGTQSATSLWWPSHSSVETSVTSPPAEAQTVPGEWPRLTRTVDPIPSTTASLISRSGIGLGGSTGSARGWQRATTTVGSELSPVVDRLLPIKF